MASLTQIRSWMKRQVWYEDKFIDSCDVVQWMDLASAAQIQFKELSKYDAERLAEDVYKAWNDYTARLKQ